MATSLKLLKHAPIANNYNFIKAQQYLKEALHIPEECPAFKQAVNAAGAADILSLPRPQNSRSQASPVHGAFHVAGGTTDLLSHGANRITTEHMSKSCAEVIRQ